MKKIVIIFCVLIFLVSFVLSFHNATLYAPSHGFDGVGHVFYIEYIAKYWNMPSPNLNWETHQSPLYYFIGALLMKISGTWKTAQYMNTFILWMLILVSCLGMWKVYKKWTPVIFGGLALAALPMLNIFPAMVTNELLNAFWIVSIAIAGIYLIEAKTKIEIYRYIFIAALLFIFGIWSKISVVMILPTILLAILIVFLGQKSARINIIFMTIACVFLIYFCTIPIFDRSKGAVGPSNLGAIVTSKSTVKMRQNPDFYYRMDWIFKVDMYNTQYYSLLGGAWNSFWTDGHNAITPFVAFHKKSFILWSLGFILLPICLYGLWKLKKHDKDVAYLIYMMGLSMLGTYVFYNWGDNHYSAVRLTYEMGIVLPYAFGIAQIGAMKNEKHHSLLNLPNITLSLLIIQFFTMVSFYWILPWWHVTK